MKKTTCSPLLRNWFKDNIGVTDLSLAANDFIFMHLQKIGPNKGWRRCVGLVPHSEKSHPSYLAFTQVELSKIDNASFLTNLLVF